MAENDTCQSVPRRKPNWAQPFVSVVSLSAGASSRVTGMPCTPVVPDRSTICAAAPPWSERGESRLSSETGPFLFVGSVTVEVILR